MKSYDIVGIVDAENNCYCLNCIFSRDICNEMLNSDRPIFAGYECDCYPTCNHCKQEIDEVQLTSDGIAWLNSTGRKTDWQSWCDAFERVGSQFYQVYFTHDNTYCLDCLISEELKNDRGEIVTLYQDMKNQDITHNPHILSAFTDNTVQYEAYPGQIIPLNGVVCDCCSEELYPPMDEELEEVSE